MKKRSPKPSQHVSHALVGAVLQPRLGGAGRSCMACLLAVSSQGQEFTFAFLLLWVGLRPCVIVPAMGLFPTQKVAPS